MTEVLSMTGFARAEGVAGGSRITVEAKAVNHRYQDFKFHLPRELGGFESRLAELARQFVSRGRLEVWVELLPGERPVTVAWNRPLALALTRAFREMKAELGLSGELDLSLLAREKDVIVIADSGAFSEAAWPELEAIFRAGFLDLQKMRRREGQALAGDILARLSELGTGAEEIGRRSPAVAAACRDRLLKRTQELLGKEGAVDPARLAQEAVLFADRSDITEEMVRTKSHLDQFREVMASPGPKGRKLDFLVQELFREINTATNKSQDAAISRLAVELKTELEKIREQVQNLE